MKNLYRSIVLSMALVAPIVSEAATFTIVPNPITTSASFGNGPVDGVFSDTYNFSVVANNGGTAQASNVSFDLNNGTISNFSAVIDGTINLVLSVLPGAGGSVYSYLTQNFNALSTGAHTLVVAGTGVSASYSGNINLRPATVGAVPVPAAVWLFGSALVGLMGVSGRKKTSN